MCVVVILDECSMHTKCVVCILDQCCVYVYVYIYIYLEKHAQQSSYMDLFIDIVKIGAI